MNQIMVLDFLTWPWPKLKLRNLKKPWVISKSKFTKNLPVSNHTALQVSILITLQRIDEAKEICLNILKKDKWNSEIFLLLGIIAKIEGNKIQAVRRFKEAIFEQTSLWLAHFYLGELFAEMNEVDKAIREYDLAIKLLKK